MHKINFSELSPQLFHAIYVSCSPQAINWFTEFLRNSNDNNDDDYDDDDDGDGDDDDDDDIDDDDDWKNNGTEKIGFVTSILAPEWHEHFKERKTSLSLPRRVFMGLIVVIDLLKYILRRFQGWGLSNVCFLWTYICARTRLRCSYLSADIEPPLVDYP